MLSSLRSGGKRKIIALHHPSRDGTALPKDVRKKVDGFAEEVAVRQREWGFQYPLPALLRCFRLGQEQEYYPDVDLQLVNHRWGPVPAPVVGSLGEYDVAVIPRQLSNPVLKPSYSPSEALELVEIYDELLPIIFHSAFEQIGNYFNHICFGDDGQRVIGTCTRIRQVIGRYLREPVRVLDELSRVNDPKSSRAIEVRENHEGQLREANAVDLFSHLLVNHFYRFYCIEDRVDNYTSRFREIRGYSAYSESDSVTRLSRYIEHIRFPTPDLLQQLASERGQAEREEWLVQLGETAAFVAEVESFTRTRPIDRPWVFLSYHFGISAGERFRQELERAFEPDTSDIQLLYGRQLEEDIRWSLLARVWFCDHQLLFVPNQWVQDDGMRKRLDRKESWIVLELLYGRLINRKLTVVVEDSAKVALEEIRRQFRDYTDECEIPQFDAHQWRMSVPDAKKVLLEALRTRRYYQLGRHDYREFEEKFHDQIRPQMGRDFVATLFESWRSWFSDHTWSVAQAILHLESGGFLPTIADLFDYVEDKRAMDDPRYVWLSSCTSREQREQEVRWALQSLMGTSDSAFAFKVGGKPLRLMEITSNSSGTARYQTSARRVYDYLTRRLNLEATDQHWERILHDLLK